MARRGDEADAEALEIVEGIAQRMDLKLTAVAGAGVDLAERKRSPEPAARGIVDLRSQLGQPHRIRRRRALGERGPEKVEEQGPAHG